MQNGHAMGALTVDTGQQYKGSGLSPASVSTHSPTSPAVGTFTQFSQQTSYGSVTPGAQSMTGQNSPSIYFGQSRRGSLTSLNDGADIVHHTPKFVRDTSKFWYKPNIGRDEAIAMLKDKQPGTFIVRDSNSFPGAYGLALKVAQVPPNVQSKGDPQAELVRHFLIEPTPKGVKLKGCSNEPVFGSLAALVYQHSITPLALPCKLLLSETDGRAHDSEEELDLILESDADPAEFDTLDGTLPSSAAQLLAQGAACNVVYVGTYDMESLTGPEAIAKAVEQALTSSVIPTVVHFKVSSQGITLTDNKRKLFFRRHYAVNSVTFCSMDPGNHRWTSPVEGHQLPTNAWVFGFVAKKTGSGHDNACHIFAELDSEQPATAIVNFVAKVMIGQGTGKVTRS
ncbi:hypothetical protein CAPTEDRAFT_177178 [Capitella teleta]|uniref:SH2 domain-containing protein n=1 Tax=Capitella teleta TaxID=283909 RepID=R7UD93_CAPTE|nr:hypothetical protein CAPTEDRAFT_177178 [Capitella teleta]|eukprot:ELU01242.1 hypothetical protein CAPTEDRAFT_177178 [Capitella teleta]